MIQKHCGERLTYVYKAGRNWHYRRPFHVWECKVCGRRFRQHVRVAANHPHNLKKARERSQP